MTQGYVRLFSYTNVVERGGLFLLTENILVRTFDSQCSKSGDFLLGAEAVTGVVCGTSAATQSPTIGRNFDYSPFSFVHLG